MRWPERFGIGFFVLLQPIVWMMWASEPGHPAEAAWTWEKIALGVAFAAWVCFRALAFMFTPPR